MNVTKTAVWQQWDNGGLEFLVLITSDDHIKVDSTVIGFEDGKHFRLRYQVHLDAHFQVQQVDLDLAEHEPIALMTDGAGHWFDKAKQQLTALNGCIDIDISATPFTNTLPIRHLDWQIGQTRSLDMVYIRIPELTFERATQQYTCLEKNEYGSLFEYSQPGFIANLPVDADGFVQNYPKLFRRLA